MEELRSIENYEQFKQALDTELANQAAGFVRTGYLLKKARDTDILAASGYSTVAEFAKAEYGLSKDIVSRYIAINDRYSEGGYSDRLQDKYEGYGVAKLQDMLTLPIEVVDLISPEMTRKEIAEVKAEVREEEAISPVEVAIEGEDVQQADMDLSQKAIFQYAKDNPEIFKKLLKWKETGDTEELESILAPSGIAVLASRPQGIGKVFTSFKGEGQPVDILAVRNNEKQTLSMQSRSERYLPRWQICRMLMKSRKLYRCNRKMLLKNQKPYQKSRKAYPKNWKTLKKQNAKCFPGKWLTMNQKSIFRKKTMKKKPQRKFRWQQAWTKMY